MENLIKIDCTKLNISEIIFKIVYVFEKKKDVILFFDLDNLDRPISNILTQLKPVLFKIIDEKKRKVIFQSIPKEIFYTTILPFSSWWKYNNFLDLIHGELTQKYKDKFGIEELNKYCLNIEKKESYQNYKKFFFDKYLINSYEKVLDFFLNEKFVKRTELVFVNSFPKDTMDSSEQRFVFYIYNNIENFKNDYSLFENFFPKNFLSNLKEYMQKAHQYVLSIGFMNDGKIRKTFYINTFNLEKNLVKDLLKKFNLQNLKEDKLWGLGFDLIDDEVVGFKTYYIKQNVVEEEFKSYLEEFEISQKVNFLFLIRHLKKPVVGVLFDEKIKKKKIVSKRIDISLQFNPEIVEEVLKIPVIKKNFFEKKEPYTLSFEFSKENKEKINLYYTLK